jgi:hypothetical protein
MIPPVLSIKTALVDALHHRADTHAIRAQHNPNVAQLSMHADPVREWAASGKPAQVEIAREMHRHLQWSARVALETRAVTM